MSPYREPSAAPPKTLVLEQPGPRFQVAPTAVLVTVAILFLIDASLRVYAVIPLALLALLFLVPRPKATLLLSGKTTVVVKTAIRLSRPRTLELEELAQVALERPRGTWWQIVLILASKERIQLLTAKSGKALEKQAFALQAFLDNAMLDAGLGEPRSPEEPRSSDQSVT
jgi:hypothetical protein